MSKRVGIILSGGEGRRMDYQNKGLMRLAGRPMIAHVIDRIAPQVDCLYLSANEDLEQYRAFGFPVIQDEPCWQGLGPLAGIASVLRQLADEDLVQVVSCDGPLIPEDLVSRLTQARMSGCDVVGGEHVPVVYPETAARPHYLYLQGEVKALRAIEGLLAENELRIRTLLAKLDAKPLFFDDERLFLNCNQAQDIAMLEERIHEEL